MRWPGSGLRTRLKTISEINDLIKDRLDKLKKLRSKISKLCFLEQEATLPDKPPSAAHWTRKLRVGVVQSITPCMADYIAHQADPELNHPPFRQQQRQHLSAIMGGVRQMLRVRETHRHQDREDGNLIDILVFPELSIHPDDVATIILPFVRTYKCIVLCGLVYHRDELLGGQNLVNSCLWLIPEWTPGGGLQVRKIEQGKQHLAPAERALIPSVVGYRPAQWLIEYRYDSRPELKPLTLSASVCYDATDIGLAADLKSRSDFYIVCALNKDVGTFDRMAEGLHYHMFQAAMVVNNGEFGGSNLFMPFQANYNRQVLHLHGQPQASIAFAEICPQKLIDRPIQKSAAYPEGEWKEQPADWR